MQSDLMKSTTQNVDLHVVVAYGRWSFYRSQATDDFLQAIFELQYV